MAKSFTDNDDVLIFFNMDNIVSNHHDHVVSNDSDKLFDWLIRYHVTLSCTLIGQNWSTLVYDFNIENIEMIFADDDGLAKLDNLHLHKVSWICFKHLSPWHTQLC